MDKSLEFTGLDVVRTDLLRRSIIILGRQHQLEPCHFIFDLLEPSGSVTVKRSICKYYFTCFYAIF